jgi:hypothetical protein
MVLAGLPASEQRDKRNTVSQQDCRAPKDPVLFLSPFVGL